MPTKEELGLCLGMDGGSGNPKGDAEVVEMLKATLDVPEDQIRAYVKTRDRSTVNCIRQVVEDMPRAPASAPARMRRSRTDPQLAANRRRAEQRINEMCKMTSSYNNSFSPGGKQVVKAPPPHERCFEGVKSDYRSSFDDWKKAAPDTSVRVFADTCRALRYFSSPGALVTTSHADFSSFPNMADARCTLPEKDYSVSNVPLGNLNSTSQKEKEAKQAREDMHHTHIHEARRREEGIFNGTMTAPEARMKMSTTLAHFMPGNPHQGSTKIGADQGVPAPSRDWKALGRASWHPGVHSKIEVAKHGHSRLRAGEHAQKEKERAIKFGQMTLKSAQDNSDVFCVANPKDSTGRQMNRFTFSKHAGFCP
jgi:hypothetical protein